MLAGQASLAQADWPQWRGPARDAHAEASNLARNWPDDGPPVAWHAGGLGAGYSSVAVVDGVVYTLGDHGNDQFLIAMRDGGEILWRVRLGPAWKDEYVGARSTPTVDDGQVFALGTEGDLVAVRAADGKEQWRVSLTDKYGGSLMKAMGKYDWKFAESPLVDGDRVVVTPGSSRAALVALDRMSGAELWRARVPDLGERGVDGAGYSSCVVSEAAGVRQYVQLLGKGVVGVEAETGRFLWGYNRVANDVANIPTPIVSGDLVFASSGYGTGAALLRIEKTEGGLRAGERYFLEAGTFQNHHGGMVLVDGYVYAGTAHNKGFPIAVALETGKVAWGPVRNEGEGSASVVYADGLLVFRYQNGQVVLIEATPEKYRELGSFTIPEVEQFSWAHPVIVGGKLYLREQDHLWVYDIAASGPGGKPKESSESGGRRQ